MFSILLFLSLSTLSLAAPTDDPRCAKVQCPAGKKCQIEQIFCYKAPCPPPQAICVYGDSENPCKDRECDPGLLCKNIKVNCFVPPCNPIAECVDPSTSKCEKNEFFDACTGCENTCERKLSICPAVCRSPGRCRCDQGFFRHKNGRCVPEVNCANGLY